MSKETDKERVLTLYNEILKSEDLKEQRDIKEMIFTIISDYRDKEETESFVITMNRKLDISYDRASFINDKLKEITKEYELMNFRKDSILKAFETINSTDINEDKKSLIKFILSTLRFYDRNLSESISTMLKKYLFIDGQKATEIQKKITEIESD